MARAVTAAPSAFVFYDGTDVIVKDRGGAREILPGGAFFLDEAQPFGTVGQAQAQADRLNGASALEPGEAWVAVAVRSIIQSITSFTPVIGSARDRLGEPG